MRKLTNLTLLYLLAQTAALPAADDVSDLVAKVKPGVVTIEVFDKQQNRIGTATGWLYNTGSSIEVVTNAHVTAACQMIRMTTLGGNALKFDRWDGYDEVADVGLIRVQSDSSLTALCLPVAGTNSVREGQAITVIGDPLGVVGVVSNGIISVIRDTELQIDAPISPGSSGSPVVNRDGEVVAMVKGLFTHGQNMNLCVRLDSIKDALTGAYAGVPVNRLKPSSVAESTPVTTKDQTVNDSEIKKFIGAYLRDCGDGTITRLSDYLDQKVIVQWYDMKTPTFPQVIDSVLEYGSRWKNQSVLWIAARCYIGRVPGDYDLYYVSVPIKWTGHSAQTGKPTTVITFFCAGVYRNAQGNYSIIGAWNDKNPKYHL